MKNQKGITLIALVITIIVLLILAGVSIAMLTGQNGILTQANSAKTESKLAEIRENVNIAIATAFAASQGPNAEEFNISTIVNKLRETSGKSDTDVTGTGTTITYKYSATETYTVTLTSDLKSIQSIN